MDLLTPGAMRRAMSRLALVTIAWLTLSGHVFSGCKGLFKPAVPEPPSGPPVQLDYSSPEATLKTMERGMHAKGQGASAWLGAFADSSRPDDPIGYHQIFDPADLVACVCQAPSDWGWGKEQEFYLDFLNVRPSDDYSAKFDSLSDPSDPPPGDEEILLYRGYQVVAQPTSGGSSTVIAVGWAELTFHKVPGDNWLISRWVDHVDTRYPIDASKPDQLTLGRRRLDATR